MYLVIADWLSQQSMWGADPSTCVSLMCVEHHNKSSMATWDAIRIVVVFTPDTRDACNMFSDVHSLKPLEAEQGSKLAVTLNVPVGLSLIFWRPWPPGRQADALVGPVPIGRRGRLVSSWGKSCLVTRGAGKAIVPWTLSFYSQEWTEHNQWLGDVWGVCVYI